MKIKKTKNKRVFKNRVIFKALVSLEFEGVEKSCRHNLSLEASIDCGIIYLLIYNLTI